mgnify:CR=1 FL=1
MDYFQASRDDKAGTVQRMFDVVAPKYDRFNAVLSLGLDTLWRNKAITALEKNLPDEGFIADIGCGSGDLCGQIRKDTSHSILGGDFCRGMLTEARKKFPTMPLSQADATNLPLADESLKGIISAFVIRNIEVLPNAFGEFIRCLKPGGRVAILEFSMPSNPIIRIGFNIYMSVMIPIACRLFKGEGEAYQYLRQSINDFGSTIDVCGLLKEAGFEDVKGTPLLLGGVTLYEATKRT